MTHKNPTGCPNFTRLMSILVAWQESESDVSSAHTFACIFPLTYAVTHKILIYLQLCWANRNHCFFTDVSCLTYTYVVNCGGILEFVNTEHFPDFSVHVLKMYSSFWKSPMAVTCSRGTWEALNTHLHELAAPLFIWLPLLCSVNSSIW